MIDSRFVMLAGLASGIGPCAGIRGAVLMSLVSAARRNRRWIVSSFVCGIVVAYMLLALILPLFAMLLANSVTLYAILAIALVASGLHVMCGSERACHGCPMPERQSIGAAFGAGLTSSAILSPCCTPLVLGILSSQGQTGHPQTAALLLGAFAVGHAVPMVAIALSLSVPLRRLSDWAKGDSAAIVTGALQIGVGVFYAVLA